MLLPNGSHVFFCKFGKTLPFTGSDAFLSHSVLGVIFGRSKKQMPRIDTHRVIATVAYKDPIGNDAIVGKFVR